MKTIAIAIIHGIGINKADFADDLVKEVKTEFNNRVELELGAHLDYAQHLEFHPIVWDRLLGERQKGLAEKIRANMIKFAQPAHGKWWEKVWVYIVRLINLSIRADFAAQFIMDIISYGDEPTRQIIFKHIEEEVNKSVTDGAKPVNIIAHSLGTVISVDFIRERQFNISNFFTMGSPIQLFSLQYGEAEFKPPVYCENANGRWVNIFDRDDPIAYRLEEISDEYKKSVHLKDYEVDCGFVGQAHIGYWKDKNVHQAIASKLALDWLLLNEKIPVEKYNQKLMDYDEMLKVKI